MSSLDDDPEMEWGLQHQDMAVWDLVKYAKAHKMCQRGKSKAVD